jgi:multidrug resistance efflux pump
MSNQPKNKPEEPMVDAAKDDTIDAEPESEDPVELPNDGAEEQAARKRRINPVTLITLLVLAFCVALFVWHLMADRFTPYTEQARVETFIVPVVPQVSGYLVEIPVVLHERVEGGQMLAQIDREPFELAVRSARAALANAGQQVGAQTAGVESAAGRLGISRARLERSQRNYDRVQRVSERNPGALSEADRDAADASLEQAQAQLISSKAELERAKQTLGSEGPDNPMIESAAAALETAQFNLAQTTITAPSQGLIESFQLDVGHYAQAGQPLMTFVSMKDAWVQADMRENNLFHLKPGDPVELVLDVAPGRVFRGTIRSVGVGVSSSQGGSRGDLPTVESVQGWLRDPQRFPVIISFADDHPVGLLRPGGQANVIVYTGDRPLLNRLARWRIRLAAWLSYVR